MRRSLLIPLLAASHGAALWLGLCAQEGQALHSEESEITPPPSAPALSIAELLRRASTREEEKPKKTPLPPGWSWEEQVATARGLIPPGTDVAAILKALKLGPGEDVSPEVAAAFSLWVDADPHSALRWTAEWTRFHDQDFDDEITRHLDRAGPSQWAQYFTHATPPPVRHMLMRLACELGQERGGDFTISLAASLPDPADRLELINEVMDSEEGLAGRIATIRGMLDEQGIKTFLRHASFVDDGALKEEILQAGFPPEMISRYESESTSSEEIRAEQQAQQTEVDAMPAAERLILAETRPYIMGDFRADVGGRIVDRVPDYTGWCADVADGRLPADELMARLLKAIPASAAIAGELRGIVFRDTLIGNPHAALRWLRQTDDNWRVTAEHFIDREKLPPELFYEVVQENFGTLAEDDRKLAFRIYDDYGRWIATDPAAAVESVRRMEEGS